MNINDAERLMEIGREWLAGNFEQLRERDDSGESYIGDACQTAAVELAQANTIDIPEGRAAGCVHEGMMEILADRVDDEAVEAITLKLDAIALERNSLQERLAELGKGEASFIKDVKKGRWGKLGDAGILDSFIADRLACQSRDGEDILDDASNDSEEYAAQMADWS